MHPAPPPLPTSGLLKPQLALCLRDREAIEATARVMNAASSGLELKAAADMATLLKAINPAALQLLVVDIHRAPPGTLETVASVCPHVRFIVITNVVDQGLLESAMRLPRLIGFVARTDGRIRDWELSYLVRRVVTPQQQVPITHHLLGWGASCLTYRVGNTRDRDRVVQAVDLAGVWFGLKADAAELAATAANDLLTNALYDAPVDSRGRQPYAADRSKSITLKDHEVPTLRLSVDGTCCAIEVVDPFGRLPRPEVFGGVLRGLTGNEVPGTRGTGLGFFELFRSGSILRVEVLPGQKTHVSWVLDTSIREDQPQARSLYYLEAEPSAP